MRYFLSIFVIAISAAATGCSTYGEKVNPAKAVQVQQGMTKEQVLALMGPPTQMQQDAIGNAIFMYLYSYTPADVGMFVPFAGLFTDGVRTESQVFTVEFDRSGFVISVTNKSSVTGPSRIAPL